MSWNLSLQLNNLYAAVKALQATAISNPVAATFRINALTANTTYGIIDCGSISANRTSGQLILTNYAGTPTLTLNANNTSAFAADITVNGVTVGKGNAGANNTILGANALLSISGLANYTTAIGNGALALATGGSGSNTGIGSGALNSVTSGANNTAVGNNAGNVLTTGSSNIYIGVDVSASATGSQFETVISGASGAIGGSTGKGNNTTLITGSTAYLPATIVQNTGSSITLGDATTTTGVIVPYGKLQVGNSNQFYIGKGAGSLQGNVVIGDSASGSQLTGAGTNNVIIGNGNVGAVMTTGSANIAIGYESMSAGVTTGTVNTCVGAQSGKTLTSGSLNTAIGQNSGATITSGERNTAIGAGAMGGTGNKVGNNNTSIGIDSGSSLVNGYENVFVGKNAGYSNTSGNTNTYIGADAGTYAEGGSANTALGKSALQGQSAVTKMTGSYNVGIGQVAGGNITSGNGNICIGHNAGAAGTSLTTGTYNILLGYGANASASGAITDEIVIGRLTGKGTNSCYLSASDSNFWLSGYTAGTLTTSASGQVIRTSDRNIKNNITYLSNAGSISRILALRPCTYELKQDDIPHTYKGFIAQDVMEILPSAVDGKKYRFQFEKNTDGSPRRDEEGNIIYFKDTDGTPLPRYLGINTTDILAEAVLAIQEQHAKITSLEAQLASLKAVVDALVAQKDILVV